MLNFNVWTAGIGFDVLFVNYCCNFKIKQTELQVMQKLSTSNKTLKS